MNGNNGYIIAIFRINCITIYRNGSKVLELVLL